MTFWLVKRVQYKAERFTMAKGDRGLEATHNPYEIYLRGADCI
jgi:hypothetical protein